MSLSPTVTSILQTHERVSSIPAEVLSDPSLRAPGKVQIARGGAKSHVATYNPNLATAGYLLAWLETRGGRDAPDLKRYEDELDAVFCAALARRFWLMGSDRFEMIGDLETGYIVNPVSPPPLLTPA